MAEYIPYANFTEFTNSLNADVSHEFNIALAAIGLPPVPKTYSKAMENPTRWTEAIQKEMKWMQEFEVFGPLQNPPDGATVLNPLWVFAHKLDSDGNIVGEKALLEENW